jgi:hypothetical protein
VEEHIQDGFVRGSRMHRHRPTATVDLDACGIEPRSGMRECDVHGIVSTFQKPIRSAALAHVTRPPTDAARTRRLSQSTVTSHERRTRRSRPDSTAL